MMYYTNGSFVFPFFGILSMLIFWAVVLWFVVWLIRHLSAKDGSDLGDNDLGALSILNSRYARGEITREQYEQMKKDIQHK